MKPGHPASKHATTSVYVPTNFLFLLLLLLLLPRSVVPMRLSMVSPPSRALPFLGLCERRAVLPRSRAVGPMSGRMCPLYMTSDVASTSRGGGGGGGDHGGKQGRPVRIAVIGGGASGMFAATAAAEALTRYGQRGDGGGGLPGGGVGTSSGESSSSSEPSAPHDVSVTVLEASRHLMSKVRISGGGRCNVLHDTSKPVRELLAGYPRGRKEITGLLTKRFSPAMAQSWFESRGVELKTEADGRMFPTTDSSRTIMDAISTSAERAGVVVERGSKVSSVGTDPADGGFVVTTKDDRREAYDCLVLATGSSPVGHAFAESLGHDIVPPVPSLFTFNMKHDVKQGGLLHGLSGLSVKNARVSFKVDVPGQKKKRVLEQEGPLLVTHVGISGPAPLKLSAFGARELFDAGYRGEIHVHFAPDIGSVDRIEEELVKQARANPRKLVTSACPLVQREIDYDNYDLEKDAFPEVVTRLIPRRLWVNLCTRCGIGASSRWGDVSKKKMRAVSDLIVDCTLEVTGKNTFKEEFVTAGGVGLKELDMTTMESKVTKGLFFCGEVINVDGITGGFNFMNCWASGYIAGNSAARYAVDLLTGEGLGGMEGSSNIMTSV